MAYDSPGTLGPTSSVPTDTTNGFDYNAIVGQAGSIVNSFLQFGSSIYAANHNQTGGIATPGMNYGPTPTTGPAPTGGTDQSNILMWIGGGLLLLLVLAGILYAVKK